MPHFPGTLRSAKPTCLPCAGRTASENSWCLASASLRTDKPGAVHTREPSVLMQTTGGPEKKCFQNQEPWPSWRQRALNLKQMNRTNRFSASPKLTGTEIAKPQAVTGTCDCGQLKYMKQAFGRCIWRFGSKQHSNKAGNPSACRHAMLKHAEAMHPRSNTLLWPKLSASNACSYLPTSPSSKWNTAP